jgi:hypothetical protein
VLDGGLKLKLKTRVLWLVAQFHFCYSQPVLEACCFSFQHCKFVAGYIDSILAPFCVCGDEVGLMAHMVDLICCSHR